MKKLLIISMICLIPGLAFSQNKNKQKTENTVSATADETYKIPGAPLPDVRFVTLDNKILNKESLASEGNLIIVLFRPDCDHCQELTKHFQDEIGLFKKTKLILLAGEMMETPTREFMELMRMDQFPQIQVALDSSNFIQNTFLYKTIPQVNVYGKDRKLIGAYVGMHGLEKIRQYID